MAEEPLNILIIEDEQVLADVTAFRLELLGYSVKCVRSANEASGWLELNSPDLIIIDAELPDCDAFDLINRVKCEGATADVPVMVFSTHGNLDAVERAYLVGAREFLVTPFDPAVLEAKVEYLLEAAN